MAVLTARLAHRFSLCFFVCVFEFACQWTESAEQTYRRAWSSYISGNLAQAAAQASAGAARFKGDERSRWYWNLRFLYAEVLAAQSNRRAAEALLRDPVPPLPGLDQAEVRRLIDLATTGSQPRNRTAELLATANASAKDAELVIRLRLTQAILAYSQGNASEARTFCQAALEIAVRAGDFYLESQTLNNLSLYAKALHQYEDSIAFGLRALDVAGRVGARRVAAMAHGNLGSTYALLGDFDAAQNHEQQAIRIFEEIGARSNLMIALGELGLLYDRQDDSAKAAANYQRAFALSRELGSDRDAARHAANIALTFIKTNQWDAAEEWNNRARELVSKSGYAYMGLLVERNSARIAWGRGRPEEAVRICRALLTAHPDEPSIRWESYYLLGVIDSAARRNAQADRSFESALRIIDENRSELLDSQNRITLLSRLIPFYQAYVDTLIDQNDDARALRVVESSRARVLSERLGRDLKPDQFPDLASFERAAASIHADILSFWLAPQRSFAWLITPGRVERFQLPGAAEIATLIEQYRATVEHSLRDPIASGDPAAVALWHAVLEKIAPRIPKNAPLLVVPDGALHRLNLETLVAPAPQPHYWIEDVQIALSPSITIAASRAAAGQAGPVGAAPASSALLVIGSPDYTGTPYEPLPNAAGEIRAIQAHFSHWTQRVYAGAQASPAAYRESNPAQFSLIHFAAHAEANYERPLESAVDLAAGGGHYQLFARDVTDIPIQARLVTISACRSAGARAYAGEGLVGFAWAFLHAGARAVIAGLWDVSDSSTAQLVDRLYGGIASGQEPAVALRGAKLALLHGPTNFRKPFYWAPFQIYLGAAAR